MFSNLLLYNISISVQLLIWIPCRKSSRLCLQHATMVHITRQQLAENLLQNSKMRVPFKQMTVTNVIYSTPGIDTKV